jgi:hypothetical protein
MITDRKLRIAWLDHLGRAPRSAQFGSTGLAGGDSSDDDPERSFAGARVADLNSFWPMSVISQRQKAGRDVEGKKCRASGQRLLGPGTGYCPGRCRMTMAAFWELYTFYPDRLFLALEARHQEALLTLLEASLLVVCSAHRMLGLTSSHRWLSER